MEKEIIVRKDNVAKRGSNPDLFWEENSKLSVEEIREIFDEKTAACLIAMKK